MTRWHAAGRHLIATVMLLNILGLHPLLFFLMVGNIIAAVFVTGAEMENRNGYQ